MRIEPSTTVARSPGVLATPVADRLVLLNDELRYIGLDRTGQAVWQLLESPRTVDELVTELVSRFDVTPSRCRTDVVAFLEDLSRHEVVTIR